MRALKWLFVDAMDKPRHRAQDGILNILAI